MNPLERLVGVIVLSSSIVIPSYAEARGRRSYVRNVQTSSQQVIQNFQVLGSYYCSNCGQYHMYPRQQNQSGTTNRRGNTIGSQINTAAATNLSNAVSTEGIYNGVGNALKVGEGLKPVFGLLDMMGTLMGGPQKQEEDRNKNKPGENYNSEQQNNIKIYPFSKKPYKPE